MRNVAEVHALDYVFGYTVANDVSARDLQFDDGQWVRGKSLDTFCPLSPVVVTADEIPDPQALALKTRVNGQTTRDSNTSAMVFAVADAEQSQRPYAVQRNGRRSRARATSRLPTCRAFHTALILHAVAKDGGVDRRRPLPEVPTSSQNRCKLD